MTDLENVFLIIGVFRPKPARFVGKSKKFTFQLLRTDFSEFKNGGKLVFVNDFKELDLRIEGKKVILIE